MNLHGIQRCPVSSRAWTLIELLGVLALLTVLSVVFVPLMIRELDGLARALEARELSAIAGAVEQGIRRQRRIPDAAEWAEFVAGELGRRVTDVQTNARSARRLWIVDPRLRLGPAPGATLPFRQTGLGSMEPVSPRVILVSSLGDPLPTTIRDGVASSNARFDAIWSAASGTVPTGWSWSGRGEDLAVERLHFGSLFVPVVLNQSSEAPYGRFGLDNGGTNSTAPGVYQTWYLRGSLLRLHGPDDSLQVSTLLRDGVSLGFERGAWRGRLSLRTTAGYFNGVAVDAAAERFSAAPGNPAAWGAAGLVTQSELLLSVSNFFTTYRPWALEGFSRGGTRESSVLSALGRMDSAAASLIVPP